MIGETIAHYRITAKIGEGGMGEVYRATDTKLDREVALKILPQAFAADADRMARFEREAKVLASLNHPNIAQIYGVEDRALVIELVEGENLKGPLPLEMALEYAKQMAEALEYAHERGVMHRDLKPANVKVTPEGKVKLLDFGLAKALSDETVWTDPQNSPTRTLGATRAGVILGTAAYMAPEQAKGKTADRRADIWAFGVVLFEMLTGRPVFSGETVAEIMASAIKDDPKLERLPASTPGAVCRLIERCLNKDPKQRLQAIGEARIVIEEVQAGVPEATATLTGGSRRSIPPWAAAGVLAAVAALTSWVAWRATRPAERPLMRLNVELSPDIVLARTRGRLALSPDGTLLAVSVRGTDGQVRLGTRRLDQSQVTPLSGTEGASFPFFSPDGEWIAFSAGGQLKKISVQGGAPVTLGTQSMGGSWGDDGSVIAVLGVAAGLSRVPSAGGVPPTAVTQLNRSKRELAHRWPQVLPGSQAALFTVYDNSGNYDDSDIEVISLKTGDRKTVYHGGFFGRYVPSGHLVFIHQNTLFAAPFDLKRLALAGAPQPVVEDIRNEVDGGGDFAFSQTGTFAYLSGKQELHRSIFWLDSAGHTQPLQPAPGLYGYPRFSPNGKRLAFELDDGQGHEDIWVHDLERDTTSRLTSLPGRNQWPVWTPDGKNIVFLASNPTAPGIFWIRADGAGEAQTLLESKSPSVPYSVSPDGKRLAFYGPGVDTRFGLWTLPLDVSDPEHPKPGKPELFLRTPFEELEPAFSPDGRWIASTSNESGRNEVYVRPFPGGAPSGSGKWQISTGGGGHPIWSRNGRELFYESPDNHIMAAAYTASTGSFAPDKPRAWSNTQILGTGTFGTWNVDLAPDGNRFAVFPRPDVTGEQKGSVHVTVLLNFFDELRRRVSVGK